MGDTQFWDYVNPLGTITAVTVPTPVSGEWSYSGAWLGAFKLLGTDLTEFYLRYRLRTNNLSTVTGSQMLGWRHDDDTLGFFSVDNLKRFCFNSGGGIDPPVIVSAPVAMQEDTWYLIELHVVIDDTVGRYEAFVDGVQYIDYTGDTKPTADTHVDNIYFYSGAYVSIYIDDLALNDTSGLTDNSWCGDGMIVKMYPNGNGTHNNWHGSDGNDVNNFELVDEYPNDGDLTYVYHDGSESGVQDQYTLSDLDFTNKTVLRIYPEARARKSAASSYTLKLGILPSGGVDDLSAARNLFADYYCRVVGDEYTVNPVDSLEWEEADLDSLQFIAEVG